MLSIEYKSTGELVPYVNNSRTHSEQQVQQVAASIKEFGFTNPILIDHDGGIIAGHGRLQAAQLLSLDEVPTITLKGLTEAQRKAYVIADNKLALNAGWNDELLKVEIEALTESDFNLDILGWDVLPDFVDEIDYSVLDGEFDEELAEMEEGVKKAIQIEFESHDYDEAAELIKKFRAEGAYIGAILIEALRKG
ncbi:MAG: ParB N-terminal domain-containing protein [Hellea sp.]|jgi:ParB family transcriptional regulator, chromosome partitioning protein|nr:ParB N-terminal domain-containing protein [Hellea sp.]